MFLAYWVKTDTTSPLWLKYTLSILTSNLHPEFQLREFVFVDTAVGRSLFKQTDRWLIRKHGSIFVKKYFH